MKRLLSALAALSLLLAAVAWSGASAHTDTGHSFDRFLKRYEAANTRPSVSNTWAICSSLMMRGGESSRVSPELRSSIPASKQR